MITVLFKSGKEITISNPEIEHSLLRSFSKTPDTHEVYVGVNNDKTPILIIRCSEIVMIFNNDISKAVN